MKDELKTRAQLLADLQGLRQRVAELETIRDPYGASDASHSLSSPSNQNSPVQPSPPPTLQTWRNIFEAIGHSIVILDAQYTIIAANQATVQATGKTAEALQGMKCYETFHHAATTGPIEGCPLTKMLSTGEVGTVEMEMEALDGIYLVSCTPVLDDVGRVEYIIHIATDITERKRAEQALKDSEEQFRTIVESAPSLLLVSDPQGRALYISPNCEQFTGYTQEEFYETMRWWVHEDDAVRAGVVFKQAYRNGRGGKNFEYKAVKKNGEVWYASSSWECLKDAQGNVKKIVLQTIDMTERKHIEAALRKSEHLLNETQRLSHVGGWEYDVASQTLFWTDEVYRIHDMPIDPHIDHEKQSLQCYPSEHRTRVQQAFQRAKEEGEPYDLEVPFVTMQGRHRWVRTVGTPVFQEGKLVKLYGNLMDVTDRKNVEEELRESEDRLRQIIEQMPYPVEICNPAGTAILVNQAFLKMFDISSADLVIGTYNVFQDGLVMQELNLADTIHAVYRGEVAVIPELILPLKTQGRWKKGGEYGLGSYEVTMFPVLRKSGELWQVVTIWKDITDRKKTEHALRESEKRFRLLFEEAPNPILVVDKHGQYLNANAAALKFLECSLEELQQKRVWDFTPPSLLEKQRTEHAPFMESRTLETDYLIHGKLKTLLLNVIPVNVADMPLLYGIGQDITERKRVETQLQRYTVQLQEMNAELSQYASVVSHDLKAPLRAIRNYSAFLREELQPQLNEEQYLYFDGLEQALEEANTLIRDLLTLSRIDREYLEFDTINIGDMLRSILFALDLPETVEIIMDDNWPVLEVELVLIRQIFQNLINNAIKFNIRPMKRIELGWRQVKGDRYEFWVRDNGIGIEPAQQERIFRAFERLHTKEEFEGTGIGLAIVKKALGKLGGTIRVDSVPDEGSTFRITLPPVHETYRPDTKRNTEV